MSIQLKSIDPLIAKIQALPLVLSHEERSQQIFSLVTSSENSLFPLFQEGLKGKNPGVFNEIVNVVVTKMHTSPLMRRCIYAIHNKENALTGFLLGTMHDFTTDITFGNPLPLTVYNTQIARDEKLHATVQKCSHFFTEIGQACFERSYEYPEGYCLDDELTRTAIQHQIPVHALDTIKDPQERIQELNKVMEEESRLTEQDFNFSDPELFSRAHMPMELQRIELCYSYLQGNVEAHGLLTRSTWSEKNFQRLVVDRNREWLQKSDLISRLQRTEGKPVCIAVGCSHLPGPEGLNVLFEKAGLIVRKLEEDPLDF